MAGVFVNNTENKLILLLSRPAADGVKRGQIYELLTAGVNWEKLISAARRHEVTPLLYHNLCKFNLQKDIPPDTWRLIETSYYYNMRRNLLIWKELASVIKTLDNAGIPVIVLKGGILMEKFYGNLALRIINDIDILIEDIHINTTKDILLRLGYKECVRTRSSKYYENYQTEFVFQRLLPGKINFIMEIHKAISGARPHKIALPNLWNRKQENILYRQKIMSLSREDMFLHCALHLRRHIRRPVLKFIVDINLLISGSLDWGYIEKSANENHIRNTVYLSVYAAKELFGTYVPQNNVEDKFQPRILTKYLIRYFLNRNAFLTTKLWRGWLLRIFLFDRMLDIFVFLWKVCFLEKIICDKCLGGLSYISDSLRHRQEPLENIPMCK